MRCDGDDQKTDKPDEGGPKAGDYAPDPNVPIPGEGSPIPNQTQ